MRVKFDGPAFGFAAFCTTLAVLGASVYALIDNKIEQKILPEYNKGYIKGREDAANEILGKLTELKEELDKKMEENETEEEEEDGS